MCDAVVIWLFTYLVHSTVLLGLAYLLEWAGILNRPRFAETIWRVALCGSLVTASLQMVLHDSQGQSQQAASPPAAWQQPVSTAAGGERLAAAPMTIGDIAHATSNAAAPTTGNARLSEELRSLQPLSTIVLPPPIHDAALAIALCWLALVSGGLLHTAFTVYRLNASARAFPICDDPQLLAFLDQLARRNGHAVPTVRLTNRWASPLVLPNGDICVPTWIFERLSQTQREAMLAHEVAHVVRRDPGWRITAQMIARLGFLQPLHRVALRRLDLAAELSCDEWAARASGHRRALAEALFSCAQTLHARKVPALTPAMTRKSTPLLVRIGSLLDGGSMFLPQPLRAVSMLAAAAVIATIGALSLPAVAIDIDVASSRFVIDARSEHVTSRIDGDLVFTATEDDVLSVSKPLVISQALDGKTLSMEFKPASSHTFTRSYLIDGKEHALDADGRAWLAKAIPTLLRESAWNASKRVQQLHDKGGAAQVLAELERIQSRSGRSTYVQAIFKLGPAGTADMARLLAVVGTIDADTERKEAYVAGLKSQRFSVPQLNTVLTGIASMESENELSEVLLAVAAMMPADQELLRHYRQSAKKLSDAERGRVEKAIDHLNV